MKLLNVITLVSVLIVTGCASLIIGKPDGPSQDNGTEKIDDVSIKRDVNAALYREPAISSTDILVSSSNGIVTLKGKVKTVQLKNRVTAIASGVAGVKAVNNLLQIR